MLSRPLSVSQKLISSFRSLSSSSSSLSSSSFKPVTTSVSRHNPLTCTCCHNRPYNRTMKTLSFVNSPSSDNSSFSSYGRDQVNGEKVDASNITPGPKSEQYIKTHEHDYEADNVGYNTENDRNLKQSASSYLDPDMNNRSEEIMQNENEVENDNRSGQYEKDLNSIPYTEHDNSSLDGKMMSSSSSSKHIPSPSDSEAIVHAEREFKDVDPLQFDISKASETNNGKFDETTPMSNEENSRDQSVKDSDDTTVGRTNRSRSKVNDNDENELHTNIPSS